MSDEAETFAFQVLIIHINVLIDVSYILHKAVKK